MKWYWWALIALGLILLVFGIYQTNKKSSAVLAAVNNNNSSNNFNPYDLIKIG